MARVARSEIFRPGEVVVVHVMSRVVRRCFLMGQDPLTGKDYNHRKQWIEELLQRNAAAFGIDLIAYSLMSNHMHLVLRSRPDVVASWSPTELARRWFMVFPLSKNDDGTPKEPTPAELDTIRNDPERLAEIRGRLSNISWWMRVLNERIARRANAEDQVDGRFWQGRFKSTRLLDESSILACAAYVDLNPVRAALAETIETSDFTSIQRRTQTLQQQANDSTESPSRAAAEAASHQPPPDAFLSPVGLDERNTTSGRLGSSSTHRCSDKGFIPLTAADYVQLLDWTARHVVTGKAGSTPKDAPEIFERLKIKPEVWATLVSKFSDLFSLLAGPPDQVDGYRSSSGRHRFTLKSETRKLLSG